jgi:hypothetical protein
MDEAAVWAEYEKLGYERGWVFAMTPLAWLPEAKTVMVGLNPGGREGEHDKWEGGWDHPGGNEYFTGRWVSGSNAKYPIQVQVELLHQLLALGPEDVFAAQFIPFRSSSLATLTNHAEALAFARRLWRWVLERSPADLFICMGNFTAWHIADLLGATLKTECPSGWGGTRVRRYVSASGKVVVGWPHPSTYRLLSMRNPEKLTTAREALVNAARRADSDP